MRTFSRLGIIILVLLISSLSWAGGSFYQWTDSTGTLSFTDDAKRIPLAFTEQSQERRFEEVAKHVRVTPLALPAGEAYARVTALLAHYRAFNQGWAPIPNPNLAPVCDQPVTVMSEHVSVSDHGKYNHNNYLRRFWFVRDECGRVILITLDSPDLGAYR